MSLTLVSLFDGIGGFPLAFSRAGVKTVATVEIDPPAASVTARHFPDAQHFDDVTRVTADDFRAAGFVPDRGIITAGWPCQDFSVAGRRAGLAGARSGLWWEVQRLLAESRPRWFVGENVPGLLSSVCEPECDGGCMAVHGGAMGSVLGSLAELGYGVAYRILDAQFFGVPQQRRRVVIVGHLGAPFGAAAQVLLEPESGGGDSAAGWEAGPDVAEGVAGGAGETGRDVAQAVVARYGKGADSDSTDALLLSHGTDTHTHTHNGSSVDSAGRRETRLPDRRRVSSRRPSHRPEAVCALTSSGVGTCGPDDNQAQAGHLIVQTEETAYQCHGGNVGPMGTLRQGNGAVTGGVPFVVQPLAVHENQRGEITTNEIAGALKTGGGKPGQGYPCVVQPLALRGREGGAMLEVGAEGGPYNALRAGDGGSSRQSLVAVTYAPDKAATLTSGTSSPGVSAPGRRQEDDSNIVAFSHTAGIDLQCSETVTPTLKAGHDTTPSVHAETIVRRLTELECERLQGYPDGWTEEGQSGSARYRELGNSIAVPVFEWVAHRIVRVDAEIRGVANA